MLQLLLQKCKSRLSGKGGAIMIQQAAQISTLAKSRALASVAVENLLLLYCTRSSAPFSSRTRSWTYTQPAKGSCASVNPGQRWARWAVKEQVVLAGCVSLVVLSEQLQRLCMHNVRVS